MRWHWIFWANVPLGIVAVLLSIRLLPESRGLPARLDLPGVGLVSAGAVGLVWGLVRANDVGLGSPEIAATLAGGAALIAAFLYWESRTPEPMLPLRLLRIRTFAAGNATAFFMTGAIFGGAFMVAQYFQFALGYSPLGTGVRLLPFTMTSIFIAPLAGAVSDRIRRRPMAVFGLAIQAIGFAWIALDATYMGSPSSQPRSTSPAPAGSSTGADRGAERRHPTEMEKASGINNVMQRFGAAVAVAIASSVFSAYGHLGSASAVTDGLRPAIGVSALLSLIGALTALSLKPHTQPRPEIEHAAAAANIAA